MKKLICKWKNGVIKEIEINCNSAKIIAISEIKNWCRENNYAFPKFIII